VSVADQDKDALALEICALDRAPIKLDAAEVSVPGVWGIFVVLPRHAPLLSIMDVGELEALLANGERRHFAVSGGFAQVLDNRVLILSQTVELGAEIEVERAEAARARAEQRLKKPDENIDVARAEAALRRALNRLKVASRRSRDTN
jgi:F-type H+-transporting ATPase subunit epsilon